MVAFSQDHEGARWDDVRVFLAAYQLGSLGAAGARLGLDVSTVSRRLTAFEAEIGARLFDRSRRGLTPTRAAELALPAAEAMAAASARLARDASSLDASAEGVVRLSVAPGFADAFVAPAIGALRARHPKITLELEASVRPLDLARREADLALRSVRPRGAELVVTKIMSGRWVALAGGALAAGCSRLGAWHDLPWIAWDHDLSSLPAARWLARHVPRAEIALRTSHFGAQLAAAESGAGAVLAPEPYVRVRRLSVLRLAPALDPSAADWPVDDLWLVGLRALRDVPRVAAVWAFLLETLRSSTARAPRLPARRSAHAVRKNRNE